MPSGNAWSRDVKCHVTAVTPTSDAPRSLLTAGQGHNAQVLEGAHQAHCGGVSPRLAAPAAARLRRPRVLGVHPTALSGPHARFCSGLALAVHWRELCYGGRLPSRHVRAPPSLSCFLLPARLMPVCLTRACPHTLSSHQPNKVVVCLHGRYAGHKAVIVKNFDEGTTTRPYGHALVCGIANYPRKVRNRRARCTRGCGNAEHVTSGEQWWRCVGVWADQGLMSAPCAVPRSRAP